MNIRMLAIAILFMIPLVGVSTPRITDPAVAAANESTPEATPEAGDMLRFALLPVGDYPEGYFKDIEVSPGSSVELTVAVDNGGTVPVHLSTYKANALSGVNGGFVSGDVADAPISATAWIDYPTREIVLEPQTQEQITFTVSVPDHAKPGQYISGLVVETADPLSIPGTDTLDQVVGYVMSISILVPGELTYSFELGDAEINERTLQIPITNTGNYLIKPSGELSLKNSDHREITSSTIQMGSVYPGLSTTIELVLPEQMPSGDYTVSLTLTDEESDAIDSIEDVTVTVPEPVDPTGVSATSATIEPNADPIVFANVAVTLNNGGQQIPAADVTLNVMRDGEEVENFPLATNQVLPNGETELSARYLPADAWESGTYTFEIVVSAVDPEGGAETILATIDVEDEIVVP